MIASQHLEPMFPNGVPPEIISRSSREQPVLMSSQENVPCHADSKEKEKKSSLKKRLTMRELGFSSGSSSKDQTDNSTSNDQQQEGLLELIISRDALCPLKPEEKRLIWESRHQLLHIPKSLPKFVLSVSYDDRFAVQDMHELLGTSPCFCACWPFNY